MRALVHPSRRLTGTIGVPGDKSVSHRVALFGALARGSTEVEGFLEGEDCRATLDAVAGLGVGVTAKGAGRYVIQGVGLAGLIEPDQVIDCGNSGTTARLLLGVLAGQPFAACLTGDASLRRRPMDRVVEPLVRMGARVLGRSGGRRLPLAIAGARPLTPLHFVSPVASAQVKSAVLLAGLWATGPVTVTEPAASRDHTERMLATFGAQVERNGRHVVLTPGRELRASAVRVPGDISSAAFFLVAGSIAAQGSVTVRGVGVNPTRTGVLEILSAMGANLEIARGAETDGEPIADVTVRPGELRGIVVSGDLVPRAIDELPVIAVAAAAADGVTEVRDAAELRVKESDRIRAMTTELSRLGVAIEERPDGFRIVGRPGAKPFRGGTVTSWGDHRLAMALVVAALAADGPTVVEDIGCVDTSYPGFVDTCRVVAGADAIEVTP